MMKVLKSRIFLVIICAIVFTSIGVIAANTIEATNIKYKETTVDEAITDLYSKVKPDYSGDTTFTPSTSTQTIQTNNKVLKSNITINPIPNNYKALSGTANISADKILSGYSAYNNDGTLVNGTYNGVLGSLGSATYKVSQGTRVQNHNITQGSIGIGDYLVSITYSLAIPNTQYDFESSNTSQIAFACTKNCTITSLGCKMLYTSSNKISNTIYYASNRLENCLYSVNSTESNNTFSFTGLPFPANSQMAENMLMSIIKVN